MTKKTANPIIKKIVGARTRKSSVYEDSVERAQKVLDGCNPVQRRLIEDTSKRKAARCPRRAGKTFAAASLALYTGESRPGARILIISLTLKSTKENYWNRSPGGVFAQNDRYDLGIKFNNSNFSWEHQNGSKGMLVGAETRADIERIRGSTAEADLIILDECKSFPPALLTELIQDVVEPGLMTRGGTLMLIGTPGSIPKGPFYQYTEPSYRDPDFDVPKCKLFDGKPLKLSQKLYSLHYWTIEDNLACRNEADPELDQWQNALSIKANRGWSDDNPTWRREYLGEWVTDIDELVYAYSKCLPFGKVTWKPDHERFGPTGLDPAEGPWNLIMGLDFGYEDANAIVLFAYSETLKELRHVYNFKQSHMTIDDFGNEIRHTIEIFGQPNIIIGDKGSLGGVLYVQELNSRFNLGIIEAEKREKADYQELLNSDFYAGRVKIILDSELDEELCALQWDLSKDDKSTLVRTGRLREDPSCSNHLCDAMLYSWRYCYHYWADAAPVAEDKQSVEYIRNRERESIERYKQRLSAEAALRESYGEYN